MDQVTQRFRGLLRHWQTIGVSDLEVGTEERPLEVQALALLMIEYLTTSATA